MQAELPETLQPKTLADLKEGEVVYTVPWAMLADENKKLWIDVGFQSYAEPAGTVQMRISRTQEGFVVRHVHDSTYSPSPIQDPSRVLPVERLIYYEDDVQGSPVPK